MNLIDQFANILVSLAQRIVEPLGSPDTFLAEVERLGWRVPAISSAQFSALAKLVGPATDLTQLMNLRQELSQVDAVQFLAKFQQIEPLISQLFSGLQAINPAGANLQGPLTSPDFWADFGPALIEQGIISELQSRSKSIFAIALATGLIERRRMPAIPAGRSPHTRLVLNWGRLQAWLKDPGAALRSTFLGPNGELLHKPLLSTIRETGLALGLPVSQRPAPASLLSSFYSSGSPAASDVAVLSLLLFRSVGSSDQPYTTVALNILAVPSKGDTAGPPKRIFFWPTLDAGVNIAFAPGFMLRLAGSAGQGANHGVILDPHSQAHPPAEVVLDSKATIEGSAELVATSVQPWVIGDPDSLAVSIQGVRVSVKVSGTTNDPEVVFAAATQGTGGPGIALKINLGQPDDFLPLLLGTQQLALAADFGVSYSTKTGWHLDLNEQLGFGFNMNLKLGPIEIQHVIASLAPRDNGIIAHALFDVKGQLGPVSFSAERLGFRMGASPKFADSAQSKLSGLSPIIGLEPPSGIGLAIDAPEIVGGGYLFFDEQKEQYSGVLQLELAETIAVKAIGLLTTRMPDGSKGFSLLVIITAEGFEPIELGFGFTLSGIGGLLGVNRTAAVDALRSGIKTGSIGSILFPENPVQNAPRIISDLSTIFPPARNRYVFGPMLMIDWGTPAILTMELGLVLEIPDPVRLLILGRLQVALPDENNALVLIHMDSLGVIDFGKGEVSLDATLYDSRLLTFVLTGDMALRAEFGANPSFLLSIGGWNPRFPAPAGFPSLSRLAISISSSDNARLRLESYLAVTSNTLQFGARADFYFGVSGFSVDGFVGFDALFHFAPFSFIADLSANVALRAGGTVLMSIGLKLSLSGPSPWHVWGSAEFSILFFSVSISIDATFGPSPQPALPPPVDVQALLVAALNDARNWTSELPAGRRPLVVFRPNAAAQNVLRVHPLAELVVRERVVPLDTTITTFGNAPVSGANRFSIAAVRSDNGSAITSTESLQDSFALAQFTDMTDDQKLSSPAFTRENSGIRFTIGEFAYGYEPALDTSITYNTLMIAGDQPAQKLQNYTMPAAALDAAASFGAAARAA